jgi:ribosomal-protein-alanine N-acetyltransferase
MISSARIRLVDHTPDHVRALIAGEQEYERRFATPVAAGLREFFLGPEVSDAFRSRLRETSAPDPWRDGCGILHLEENRLIGVCGFNGPPDADGAVEIAYGIAPAYQGQGYATAAAALLVSRAFADENVQRVHAYTLPEQNASTGVLRKCGFKRHHQLVDSADGCLWRWEMERADFASE